MPILLPGMGLVLEEHGGDGQEIILYFDENGKGVGPTTVANLNHLPVFAVPHRAGANRHPDHGMLRRGKQ
jgi:hypothetical protein